LCNISFTWVYLPVTSYTICVHNVLEASCEFIGPVEGRGSYSGFHFCQDGDHGRTTELLQKEQGTDVRTRVVGWESVHESPHELGTSLDLDRQQSDNE
jgi:hypothetical protein